MKLMTIEASTGHVISSLVLAIDKMGWLSQKGRLTFQELGTCCFPPIGSTLQDVLGG